ncbi:MAG: hypothetical protein K8S25_02630 [Alphaproteobacteria bacterium]|nr:hypothetical protein [Alphaproteobacteria bacterium]
MNKLPVFKTVGQTFGFVVERRFFSLLRLIWLPTLLSLAIAMIPLVYQFEKYGFPPAPGRADDISNDAILNGLNIVNFFVSTLLSAIIAVSVHRMILLDDVQKGVYFYWRLTREEWLYIAAWIGYFIVVAVAFALPIVGHFYWLGHSGGLPNLTTMRDPKEVAVLFQSPGLIIAGFLSVLFGLVALSRFGLVFPLIVAEGRLSFARSWVLTRGNFWRLIGFWISVVVLTYVLIFVMIAILGVAAAGMYGGLLLGGKTVGALGILVLAVPAAVSLIIYLVVGITIFIAAMSFTYKALADPVAPTEAFE